MRIENAMSPRWESLKPQHVGRTTGLRHVVICALVLTFVWGCHSYGSKITFTVKEDSALQVAEFTNLFAESNLNYACYWYFGNKNGYVYVEIDEPRAIDEYDDVLNRREHHTLRRYRVAETDVEFIPRIDFVGWDGYGGKRITEFRKDVSEGMAVYRIKSPTNGGR